MKGSPSGTTSSFNVSGATGKGEIWIRTDDSQIFRQLVKLSVDMDADLGIPGASPTASGSKFEICFDIKFSHIGEPVSPAITAPPTR